MPAILKHPMKIVRVLSAALGLTLAGCASQKAPPVPTVMALLAKGEGFAMFQQHDTTCRHYAYAQIGGQSPDAAAANSGLLGATLGAGLGAAAGAAIGSESDHAGTGAGIGAGTGLLAGGLLGGARAREAAKAKQSQYDMAYTQCMVANGEQMAQPLPPTITYTSPSPSVAPAPVVLSPAY